MFLAVHAAVGALAGNAVSHPTAAFLLGAISHFFLDMIPHGDEVLYRGYVEGRKKRRGLIYIGVDAAFTAVLIPVFFLNHDFFSPLNVALGIIGSLLPDLLVGLSLLFPPRRATGLIWRLDRFAAFHRWNHILLTRRLPRIKYDIPLISGIALQAVVLGLLIKVIL